MGDLEELRYREAFGLGEFSAKKVSSKYPLIDWGLAVALVVLVLVMAFGYNQARKEQEYQTYELWRRYTAIDMPYEDWRQLRRYNALPSVGPGYKQ